MRPVEDYFEHADGLAQEVVNAWGVNVQAGNSALLTDEFKALLDKAYIYRDSKRIADNRRDFNMLSEREGTEEQAARQAFAEAYKSIREKHQAA